MSAALPTQHSILGVGAYGCVYDSAQGPCRYELGMSSKGAGTGDRFAYKVQKQEIAAHLMHVNAVLDILDSEHKFTVPLLSYCSLRQKRAPADCAPLKDFEGDLCQFKMNKGVPLSSVTISRKEECDPIVQTLASLARGIHILNTAGFVHGDIKMSNILYFPDKRFRFIDYDLFASVNLIAVDADNIDTTKVLEFRERWRTDWLRKNDYSKVLKLILGTDFLQYGRFAVKNILYSPPENCITSFCFDMLRMLHTNFPAFDKSKTISLLKTCAATYQTKLYNYFCENEDASVIALLQPLDFVNGKWQDNFYAFIDRVVDVAADDLGDPTHAAKSLFVNIIRHTYYPLQHDPFQFGFFLVQFSVHLFKTGTPPHLLRKILETANQLMKFDPSYESTRSAPLAMFSLLEIVRGSKYHDAK